jgi:ribosomal protein S20
MKCTNKSEAQEKLKSAYALADKLVVKGILHRNKSAHVKSQIALKVKTLQ